MEGIKEKYATSENRDEYKTSNKLMDLITHVHIYALLPNFPQNLKTDYIKYYNPNLEFSEQFKLHTEELGKRLERYRSKNEDIDPTILLLLLQMLSTTMCNISSTNQRTNKKRYNRKKKATQNHKNFENLESNGSGYDTEPKKYKDRNNRKYYNTRKLCFYCQHYRHLGTNCIY